MIHYESNSNRYQMTGSNSGGRLPAGNMSIRYKPVLRPIALLNHQKIFQFIPSEVGYSSRANQKAMTRRTIDYNYSTMNYLENSIFNRNFFRRKYLQKDSTYLMNMSLPIDYLQCACNSVMSRFIRPATNKDRCCVYCLSWTPDGRRLLTGTHKGEFTLWHGLTFNFVTILQAHENAIRTMKWTNNEQWLVSGDNGGIIKYWQANMNAVNVYQAHKDLAIKSLCISPSDTKLATCADDGTLRIHDFTSSEEEKILLGHGAEAICVDWHPTQSLVTSGSRDNQQPVILWDPRDKKRLMTLYCHKGTCVDLKWNRINGNWLLTGSRDHLIKLFDLRNLSRELQTFRGINEDITRLQWHPIHEKLFVNGSGNGTIGYWMVGKNDGLIYSMKKVHDNKITDVKWHPLGHVMATCSDDQVTKFWSRSRPGDLSYLTDEIISSATQPIIDEVPEEGNDIEMKREKEDVVIKTEVDEIIKTETISREVKRNKLNEDEISIDSDSDLNEDVSITSEDDMLNNNTEISKSLLEIMEKMENRNTSSMTLKNIVPSQNIQNAQLQSLANAPFTTHTSTTSTNTSSNYTYETTMKNEETIRLSSSLTWMKHLFKPNEIEPLPALGFSSQKESDLLIKRLNSNTNNNTNNFMELFLKKKTIKKSIEVKKLDNPSYLCQEFLKNWRTNDCHSLPNNYDREHSRISFLSNHQQPQPPPPQPSLLSMQPSMSMSTSGAQVNQIQPLSMGDNMKQISPIRQNIHLNSFQRTNPKKDNKILINPSSSTRSYVGGPMKNFASNREKKQKRQKPKTRMNIPLIKNLK
ncbi:hypothetical protein SNEBB_006443 [Seison nebaliae]|nr:hypothetical protein SNEBB_006443 [Seison nebaliae]